MKTIEGTRQFYDDFLEKRMVSYLLNGNLRLDRAFDFALSEGAVTGLFLDFGCGIGYFSEKILDSFPNSRGVAVDAGPANVRFAVELLKGRNIDIHQFGQLSKNDVAEHFNPIIQNEGFDFIFLIDVVEHLPKEARQEFFTELRSVSSKNGKLIMTYPSPDYQKHLKDNNPDELQYIDEEIPSETIIKECKNAGWTLRTFRSADVWLENQYFHFCFTCAHSISPINVKSKPKKYLWQRGMNRIKRARRKKMVGKIMRRIV